MEPKNTVIAGSVLACLGALLYIIISVWVHYTPGSKPEGAYFLGGLMLVFLGVPGFFLALWGLLRNLPEE